MKDFNLLITQKEYAGHYQFWSQQLARLPGACCLREPGREGSGTATGPAHYVHAVQGQAVELVNRLAADDAGKFVLTVSLFQLLLARQQQQAVAVVNTPLLGRPDPARAYVPEIPVILGVDPEDTLGDWLRQAHQRLADSYKYQAFPVDALYQRLSPLPFGQLTNVRLYTPALHPAPVAGRRYGFSAGIAFGPADIRFDVRYDPDQLSEPFVRAFLGRLEALMLQLTDLEKRLRDVGFADAEPATAEEVPAATGAGRGDDAPGGDGYGAAATDLENRLRQLEGITDCVVEERLDDAGEPMLVVYYVAGQAISRKAFRQFLAPGGEEHPAPAHFVRLSALPLTISGKVNRPALPDPGSVAALPVAYQAPGTDTERKMVDIWQQVMGKTGLGVRSDFFEIGGHSLKAMKLISCIDKEMGVRIDMKSVFAHSTIERLSALVEKALPRAYQDIQPIEEQEHYDLSFGQKRLWLESHLRKQLSLNVTSAYVFTGDFDPEAFDKAFRKLVERHEVLRTTFEMVDGIPRQRVWTPERFNFQVEYPDVRAREGVEEKLRLRIAQQAGEPFDLAKGPLMRAVVYRIANNRYVFSLIQHHIVTDDWSQEILAREVLAFYQAYREDQATPLAPLKVQQKDCMAWQKSQLAQCDLDALARYWAGQTSVPVVGAALPTDFPRPDRPQHKGASTQTLLGPALSVALKALAHKYETSLYALLLTALNVLLYRLSGRPHLAVGSPVNSRNHKDLEGQLGVYIHVMVIRAETDACQPFSELLQTITDKVLQGLKYQEYPPELLPANARAAGAPGPSQQYHLGFTWHALGTGSFQASPGFAIEELDIEHAAARTDLWFHGSETEDGGISLSLDYDQQLFSARTAARLLDNLEAVLAHVAGDESAPIYEINIAEAPASAPRVSKLTIDLNLS